MNKLIDAFNISDNSTKSFNLPMPVQCPCCNTALEPKHLCSFFIIKDDNYNDSSGYLYSLHFCPKCEECFLAHYLVLIRNNGYQSNGKLMFLTPSHKSKTPFSDKVSTLSPNFVKIYHQAETSESIGLNEICGLGYRKALEFLVKDYAIAFHPNNSNSIKSKMLSPCINEYIDNERIKSLATASAWIGNDEAHYVRKNEDYNLGHLKAFISAIVSYIDSELSYLEAESLLNKTKK